MKKVNKPVRAKTLPARKKPSAKLAKPQKPQGGSTLAETVAQLSRATESLPAQPTSSLRRRRAYRRLPSYRMKALRRGAGAISDPCRDRNLKQPTLQLNTNRDRRHERSMWTATVSRCSS